VQSFKTNIKCAGCVSNVKPYLDSLKGVTNWHVDLASQDRILIVEGDISSDLVIKALAAAGYRAESIA